MPTQRTTARQRALALLTLLLATSLTLPARPTAATELGVVTAVTGEVTVSRAVPADAPVALRFQEALGPQDTITSQAASTARLLLEGATVVTLGEQTRVTVERTTRPDGGADLTLRLAAGRLALASVEDLLPADHGIAIATPNARASGRGMVVLAEYLPPEPTAAAPAPVLLAADGPIPLLPRTPPSPAGPSSFVALGGAVTVTPAAGPPVPLGSQQMVRVTTTPVGVHTNGIQTLTPAQVAQAAPTLPPTRPHLAAPAITGHIETELATALTHVILGTPLGARSTRASLVVLAIPSPATVPVAPVVPPVPSDAVRRAPGPAAQGGSQPTPSPGPVDASPGGAGPAVRVDPALIAAASPAGRMVTGSPTRPGTEATVGAMPLYRDIATTRGAFRLTTAEVTVQNGPLLVVDGKSTTAVTRDLAVLTNGARLTVFNGPLINLNGGSALPLTITGALVGFVGGGNQVIINNAITPAGINATGSVILINNAIPPTGVNVNGSLIRTTGGGAILIKGQ
jgi:hypothetical protein